MSQQRLQVSRFLSYVLRHQPEAIGLQLDPEGWVEIETLICQANQHGQSLTLELVREVVATSDKKRFTLSATGQKIRAAQGHSTSQVSIQFIKQAPPEFLYHGTATRFLDSIRSQGLLAGTRHHVHLSSDKHTATQVGERHGKPAVLTVQAQRMTQQGFTFYLTENGVWLTQHVPAEFLLL